MKKRLIFILTLAFIMTMGCISTAFAADDETTGANTDRGYQFKITVSAGEKGLYQGKNVVSNYYYSDEEVTLNIKDVKVTDDKYYPRGFRIAGHDNDEAEGAGVTGFTTASFKPTEDINYEVAYGIKGDLVAYTVRYVDQSGNPLLDEEEFYGMPGDKPVASYRYVEGYLPQTFTMAKRLTNDPSQNIFEFVYSRAATDEQTTTVTVVRPGAPGTAANPAGTGVAAAGAGANAGAGAGAGANAGAGDGGTTIGDNGTPLADGPQQFTDLDDNDTPQAEGLFGQNKIPFLIGSAVLLAIIIALILFYLKRRRAEEAGGGE